MTIFYSFTKLHLNFKPSIPGTGPAPSRTFTKLVILFNHSNGYISKKFAKHIRDDNLWKTVAEKCNNKMVIFGEIITQQFNFYTAQRIRRLSQIASLYQRIYTEKSIERMVSRLATRWQNCRPKSLGFLLGASLFNWQQEKITENEMNRLFSIVLTYSLIKNHIIILLFAVASRNLTNYCNNPKIYRAQISIMTVQIITAQMDKTLGRSIS